MVEMCTYPITAYFQGAQLPIPEITELYFSQIHSWHFFMPCVHTCGLSCSYYSLSMFM